MGTGLRLGAVGWLTALAVLWGAPCALGLTGSQSFTVAGEHAFTVPAGVTSVQVGLVGGNGGAGDKGVSGGVPATASATFAVTPGEILYAEVAGDGGAGNSAGMDMGGAGGGGAGGGVSGLFAVAPSGGGGGGASDVRTCSVTAKACQSPASRLVVAAGGGGGSGDGADAVNQIPGGPGGPADVSGYDGGGDGFSSDAVGTGGAAGTAGGGGVPGTGSNPGFAGTLGVGGDGGLASFVGGGGGGGGGGIYGGGGGGSGTPNSAATGVGASGGGGGGGSSGVPASASGVSGFSLVPTAAGAEPKVTFTWTLPAPAVITGTPAGVTGSSATATGTVNPNNSMLTECHFTVSPAPPAGSVVSCPQQIGGGSSPVAVSATLSGLSPATAYTVTLSAASAAGQASGSPISFMTSARSSLGPPTSPPAPPASPPAPPMSPPGPPGSAPTPSRAPTISGLAVARRVHRAVAKRKRAPVTITLRLSSAASLSFAFEHVLSGRRSKHGCLATKTRSPRAARCVRYVRVLRRTFTVAGRPGVNTIRFHGSLDKGKRLPLGSYRLTVVAAGSAGKSAPRRATFTLIG